MKRVFTLLLLVFAATMAWSQTSQDADEFHWKGRLPADKVVEIKNVNGSIEAQPSSGDEIQVDAIKTGRDRAEVKVEVMPHSDGVTICAVYPGNNSCESGTEWHSHIRNVRAQVEFSVKLPRNLRLTAITVNGKVDAMGMGRYVYASSVNGSVRVETDSWARASSVNGSVHARMGRADWPGKLEFESVNGSIELEVPSDLNAEIRFRSVNGHLESDFPVTAEGRLGGHEINGRIGNGGRELVMETVNGSVRLHKASM